MISFFGLLINGIWILIVFGIWFVIIWMVVVVVNEFINGVDIYDEINLSLSNFKIRSKILIMKEEFVVRVVLVFIKFILFICMNVMLLLVLFVFFVWDGGIVMWFFMRFVVNKVIIVLVLIDINGYVLKIMYKMMG